MQAIILAGGRGTRLGSITETIPKPMVPVHGKPLIAHQIETLARQNFKEVIVLTGYLGEVLEEFLGDGSKWNINIRIIKEHEPLGTAGCLRQIKSLVNSTSLLIFGDIFFDVDLELFIAHHIKTDALVTIAVHPNDHPFDSDIVEIDEDGYVQDFLSKKSPRTTYGNNVMSGIFVISASIFEHIPGSGKQDFTEDFLIPLVKKNVKVASYRTSEYMKDLGTLERLEKVEMHYKSGITMRRSKRMKQKAIFLDRDGTINRHVGLLSLIEYFELLPGVSQAIRAVNNSEYLCICITNQPVIARNLCNLDDLNKIHKKMEMLLGQEGAFLDAIYFCPHHPDKGYPEERPEYKIECNCRKPKPGMVLRAMEDYNIDLGSSFVIGDQEVDIKLAKTCGMQGLLVNNNKLDVNGYGFKTFPDLPLAIQFILGQK